MGQRVTTTALAEGAAGQWLVEVGGQRLEARSELALEPGGVYHLVVVRTSPGVILAPAPRPVLPSLAKALVGGSLGPDPAALLRAIAVSLPEAAWPMAAVDQLQRRTLRGTDLTDWLQHAARFGVAPSDETDPAAVFPSDQGRAGEFVELLEAWQRDQATRLERQGMTALPLPLAADGAFDDARMYFEQEQPGETGSEAGGAVTHVVLLLRLSRRGAVRVDVKVRGDDVRASFVFADQGALDRVRASLGELKEDLEGAGLAPRELASRWASAGQVPIADVVLPPGRGESLARVDLHA
ncbi:MAG: flagellar hook-length control protein FliK [Planctomycetota bacterium]